MERICDMHTHTIYSDGTLTPRELIDEAIGAGLSALALTDHNTVEGLPEFISAASGKDIDIVLGSEFSVDYDGQELHLLALFIDQKHFPKISALMTDVMKRKQECNRDLVKSLIRAGLSLDYDEITAGTPSGKINRAHVAEAMIKKGYVGSLEEAFSLYLHPSAGYYREPKLISVFEMIDFIKSIGAVSVLAHPFLQLSEEKMVEFLPKAKAAGLDGIECYYSKYDEATTATSLRLADEFGLLKSGGSDYHGARKPGITIGSGKGNLRIPYEWYLRLKERAK